MDVQTIERRRRDLAHRILFVALLALLAVFAVWCVTLLFRTQSLQAEIDAHFGWIDDVRQVKHELERLRGGGDAGEATARLEAFLKSAEDLARHDEDPALAVTVRRLRETLAAIPRSGREASSDEEADDALWQAAVAALSAVEALEGILHDHVSELHRALERHWRSLYLLAVCSLVLAGWNFSLLFIAHRRRRAVEEAHAKAMECASHDPLTGIWNREGILRLLGHELVRAQRTSSEVGVIFADIDDFRRVNEAWGQDQGDYVLQQVAQRLQSVVRPYDNMGRFDGDSFLLVLPSCDAAATNRVASRVLRAVNGHDVEHAFGHLRVTLSLAQVTVARPSEATIDRLLLELQEQLDQVRQAA